MVPQPRDGGVHIRSYRIGHKGGMQFGMETHGLDLGSTEQIIGQDLDKRLKEKLKQESRTNSYTTVLDEVVDEFFMIFMLEHSADIQKLVQVHTARLQNGDSR